MLQQLQQHLRTSAARGRSTARVGPFLVTIDEGSLSPFLNYAIPDDRAVPTRAEAEALADAMAARGRVPRLEYLERTAPLALPVLERAGFAVELRPPALVCRAPAALPVPDGYALVPPGDEHRRGMLGVQDVAFGAVPVLDAVRLDRSRALEEAGGVALAVLAPDGSVVGGGVATPTEGLGFTEVAGIAVAAAHRRRGLAAVLTAELTRRALAADAHTAYMTPGDDEAARVYARAGFEGVGHMLHLRRG